MKATFEVDLSDKAQVDALIAFLQGTGTITVPKKEPVKKATAPAAATSTATATSTITVEQLGELTVPKKEPVKKETAPAAATSTATATSTITVEQLGELTSAKVKAGHRDAIKAKLDELGAPRASALKPEQYQGYFDFLNTLK